MTEFEIIKADQRLIYEYIRGSYLYNLNTETSDVDTSGVFLCKPSEMFSLNNAKKQVSDAKNDNTWYEIGFYLQLLLKSNSSIIESLFIPKDKIITPPNALMEIILDNRTNFLTKSYCKVLMHYARNQIYTARSLNKKISNPIAKRLSPLDFVYTFYNQGSIKITQWLSNLGIKQEFCGLVNISNMHDVYGVYYDWGAFFQNEDITIEALIGAYKTKPCNTLNNLIDFILDTYKLRSTCLDIENQESTIHNLIEWFNNQTIKNYKGIIGNIDLSNELHLSSIAKNDIPICHITYNKDGYSKHCTEYSYYKKWEKERNPIRYQSNLQQNYDSKNMMHCFRLLHMGIEVANGDGLNVTRTWDRDFLLRIKNHQFEYDELLLQANNKLLLLENAITKSNLIEKIDNNLINDILIEIRKKQFNIN